MDQENNQGERKWEREKNGDEEKREKRKKLRRETNLEMELGKGGGRKD